MKLGEVISKAKTVKCKERVLPVLSITMRDGFVLQSDKFKKEIASKDKSSYNVVKRNQLVQSIHIDEGGFAVQTLVDEGIVSPAYRIWDVDTSKVDGEYLSTILRSPRSIAFYKSKLRGSIQRRGKIDDADILGMDIPVPSIPEQYQILDELHLLTGIIDKQKAQLKELDTLAQSIFYDMLGDPVENEKGWEIKEMGELFNVGSSKRVFESQWTESGVPFYRAREIVRMSKNEPLESPIFISEELFADYSNKYGVPSAGDMMVTAVGTLGVCYIVKESDRFYFKDGNILWFNSKGLCETRFIKDQYTTGFVANQIQGNANAAVVGTYTIMNAKKTKVIVPPRELQKMYVQKVESIDKQKASINRSIAETQKLFDYTMDKYFG